MISVIIIAEINSTFKNFFYLDLCKIILFDIFFQLVFEIFSF